MGWTWGANNPIAVLQQYPALADNAVLREQWPAFRVAADDFKGNPPAPGAGPEAAGPEEAGGER